jgi:branched-subunit amino acid ABC-type transport system permease component
MMETKISWNLFIAIISVVLLVTAYNAVANPVTLEVTEEEFGHYSAAGAGFEGDKGMRFNYSHLGDGGLSYNYGLYFRVLYEHNETDLNYITSTWVQSEKIDMLEAVERSYNYSDPRRTEYTFGETMNETIFEHYILYTTFNKTSTDGNRTGYVGQWNCTNSARLHTFMVENAAGYNQSDLFRVFNQTRSTMRCHYPGQRPPGSASIKLPFDVNTLINVNLMIMLTIGFSFTFMMENFPNFAHTTYAGVGALASFYLTRFFNFNPYDTWPFAALFGGLVGVALYRGIVKPIRRNGGYQDITLTFTFIMVAVVLPNLYLIFNFWARYWGDVPTRGYNLGWYDFDYNGIPGIAIMSTALCIFLIVGLRYFLTQHKVGLSLRAVAENPDLAETIGINTERAHDVSWFISGALASLVGSVMTIYRGVGLGGPDGMIINVMSGAIMGGVYNVYGAIIGGMFVALAEDFLKKLAFQVIGLAADKWQNLFPILFLVIALLIFPNGITGVGGIDRQRLEDLWEDIMNRFSREDTAS